MAGGDLFSEHGVVRCVYPIREGITVLRAVMMAKPQRFSRISSTRVALDEAERIQRWDG
jgi:hypothetical protein